MAENQWEDYDDELDEDVDALLEVIQDSLDGAVFMPNPKRILEIEQACAILKRVFLEMNPDATFDMHKLSLSPEGICLTINDVSLDVTNMPDFVQGISKADNFSIVPKRDETVDMAIVFYGAYVNVGKTE